MGTDRDTGGSGDPGSRGPRAAPATVRPGLLLLWLLLAAGCATTYSPERVQGLLDETLDAARLNRDNGRPVEAAQLVESVLAVDEEYPGARELRDSLESDAEYLYDHPLLGSNFTRRARVERSGLARALLYLPDRLLDLADVLSVDLHFGPGALANVHFTRAIQAGVGARGVGGIGWHDHRSLGVQGQAESQLVLPGVGAQAYSASLAGTSGVVAVSDAVAGLHRPSSRIYQRYRDYWAVGVDLTALLFGVDVDLHPVELADFFVGWGGIDLLHDDFAGTRGLRLSRREETLLRILSEVQGSRETMEDYRAFRGVRP